MRLVDAHHHVWDTAKADYPWLGDHLGDLNRTVEFQEFAPLLDEAGIESSVLVQASDNEADTAHLLDVADAHPQIGAVVGWIPLDQPAAAEVQLHGLLQHRAFRGVRPGIHFMEDVDWLLRPPVDESLRIVEAAGVRLDLVSVRRRHLELVPILSERYPALRMVIDHLSKPPIGKPDWEPWRTNMIAAARNPNVYAKVSGLFPARGRLDDWDADLIRPYWELALEHFGAERLMFGSDWPISDLAGGFRKIWREYNVLFATLSARDRARVLGGTAVDFYAMDI